MNIMLPSDGRPRARLLAVVGAIALLAGLASAQAVPALAAEPSCPNEELRAEQPFGSTLPDCRAFEMVSPLAKDDNGVSYIESRAAVSGEAVTYYSLGSFAEPKSALLEGRYLSRREANGWSTRNISPPYTDYRGHPLADPAFGELLFTPDLSSGIMESEFTPLVSGQPVGYLNLYLADTETGSYRAITTVTPEMEYQPFKEGPYDTGPQAEGASTDLSHVVFQQIASLCCGASPKRAHVYEWADGKLSLVDVPPEGGKLEGADDVGATANFNEPSALGNPWRAVSSDGSRVVFTGGEVRGGHEIAGQVYVRKNPMSSVEDCLVVGDACTVEVSASQKTNGGGSGGTDPYASIAPAAWYRGASTDGSRVFFVSRVELTNDANTGPEDNAANLYEYDLETGVLSDLSVDDADPDGAGVLGLVTASEDGSYVYFVAEGRLSSEANGEGEEPVAGKPNLYLYHQGHVSFIAMLAPTKIGFYHGRGSNEGNENNGDEEDWVGEEGIDNDFGPGRHTARVTPDGTRLVFESERSLTGYDNEPAEPVDCKEVEGQELSETNPSVPCREVYLYDATTGKLICVSCDPDGSRPVGPAELGGHQDEGTSASVVLPYYLPRNLSEDGGRLFFQSPDALVPHDSNGLVDVYEWERVGEGSCTSVSVAYTAGHDGCTFSVSDVAGSFASHFMDASADGDDVFIATGDQLVSSDTDSREDVYDVRVGGGFPVQAVPPVCANADSCKPPVSAQPGVFGAPASATFSGPGNPVTGTPPPPPPVVVSKSKAKVLAGAQRRRLARALGACRKRYGGSRGKRAGCEKKARRIYGEGR